MKRTVIHRNNLPFKPGIPLIVWWLLFDRLHAPEWLWGIYWLITALAIFFYLGDLNSRKEIKIFKDKE